MKLHLPVSLLSLLLAVPFAAAASTTDAATNWGNVMYVGDSITHGVDSASYRWALHKILVDNGVSYNSVGVMSGNHSGGVAAGTSYGNVEFNNVHSSQASARAYEIAGRQGVALDSVANEYGRFDYSNIQNWLGQSTVKNNNAAYTGATFTEENGALPDKFFLLIGTNDTLSNYKNQLSAENVMETVGNDLLGDMNTIITSMHEANAQADIIVMTVPCWTQHQANNNNNAENHEAISAYNEALTSWVAEYNAGLSEDKREVTLIDVNKGILDVASSTPYYGCSSMFRAPGSDGVHPNAQGDLLMAGNLAKALGYAGRSAGQERRGTAELAVNFYTDAAQSPVWESVAQLEEKGFSVTNATVSAEGISMGAEGTSSVSCSWAEGANLQAGFTLDLGLTLGNGSTDGWNTSDNLSVTLGTADFYGTLNVNEAYIKWGNTVLYSADMSQNSETLRMAWLPGYQEEGLASGYYVWLGDMLIGEALDVTYGTGKSGLTISYSGTGNALITDLALDGTGSYAPTTTGLVNTAAAYTAAGYDLPLEPGAAQGNTTWVGGETATHTATNLAVSGTYNARSQADNSTGAEGRVVSSTVTSGSTTIIYGNSANYTGDVWLTISNEGGASSWFAAHGGSGTLTGDANLRFTGTAAGGSTVFGAVNATKVTENVYVELSAADAVFASFTGKTGKQASLVGAYETNIGGNVDLVVNAGTLNYAVMGGIHTGAKTIGGKASVYVNGGLVKGNVMGGGLAGTIEGGSSVTVAYHAQIKGNVYGGGGGGTIKAPATRSRAASTPENLTYASYVELTGGTVEGDVYGGGYGGTIDGNSGVLVSGSAAILHDGTSWGNINAGGSAGTITGDAVVTLRDIVSTTTAYAFDKYAGTIDGGTNVNGSSTLILDNVQLTMLKAELINFDTILATNGTATELTSFGGATTVSIGDGCSLVLNADTSTLTSLMLGENASLSVRALLGENVLVDISGVSNYSLTLTNLADGELTDVSNIRFVRDGVEYAAMLSGVDLQANSASLVAGAQIGGGGAIPEPATATLSLLALAALASRRRRK